MSTPDGAVARVPVPSVPLGRAARPRWAAPARVLGVVTLAQGAAYLLAPDRLLRAVAGRSPRGHEVGVTRLLGGRLVLQGLVLALTAAPELPRAGRRTAAVDGAHGLTMVALAAVSPRHRTVALASAGSAFTSALATFALVPRPHTRRHA